LNRIRAPHRHRSRFGPHFSLTFGFAALLACGNTVDETDDPIDEATEVVDDDTDPIVDPGTDDPDTDPDTTFEDTCDRAGMPDLRLLPELYSDGVQYGAYDAQDDVFWTLQLFDDGLGSPIGPGTYSMLASPDDCEQCLYLATDCSSGTCSTLFAATDGELVVSSLDRSTGDLAAQLQDVVLTEVEFPEGGGFNFIPNGQTWCVSDYSFDVTMAPTCLSDAECAPDQVCVADACVALECDVSRPATTAMEATAFADEGGEGVTLELPDGTTLQIIAADRFGPPYSIDGPGVYTLGSTAEDRTLFSCETCVRGLGPECNGEACEGIFIATGGTLEITAWEPAQDVVAGTLSDVELTVAAQARCGPVAQV